MKETNKDMAINPLIYGGGLLFIVSQICFVEIISAHIALSTFWIGMLIAVLTIAKLSYVAWIGRDALRECWPSSCVKGASSGALGTSDFQSVVCVPVERKESNRNDEEEEEKREERGCWRR